MTPSACNLINFLSTYMVYTVIYPSPCPSLSLPMLADPSPGTTCAQLNPFTPFTSCSSCRSPRLADWFNSWRETGRQFNGPAAEGGFFTGFLLVVDVVVVVAIRIDLKWATTHAADPGESKRKPKTVDKWLIELFTPYKRLWRILKLDPPANRFASRSIYHTKKKRGSAIYRYVKHS